MEHSTTATIIVGVSLSNLFIEIKSEDNKLIATLPNKNEICISTNKNENGRWVYDFYKEFKFDEKFYVGVTDIEINLELYKPKNDNINLNDIIIGIELKSVENNDDDLTVKIENNYIINKTDNVRKQLIHLYSYFEDINLYLMNSISN